MWVWDRASRNRFTVFSGILCEVYGFMWFWFELTGFKWSLLWIWRDNRNSKESSKNAGLHDLKIEIYCSYRFFGSEITAFFEKAKVNRLNCTCNLGHHLMEIPAAPIRFPETKPTYMTKQSSPCISHSFLNHSPVLHPELYPRKCPFGNEHDHFYCKVEEFIIMSHCKQTIDPNVISAVVFSYT